jgi:hypothetical protein
VVGLALGSGCNEFTLQGSRPADPTPVSVTETFRQEPLPAVDILWVIDGTPSMDSARDALVDGLVGFLDRLDDRGLAWQVGVCSTDLGDHQPGQLRGDPWILTPATKSAEAALLTTIGAVAAGEPSGGLGAAMLAVSAPLATGDNRGFRRDNAALHVVIVSDSDDESEALLGPDPASAALEFLDTERERTGRSARISAVVGDAGTGCSGPDGTALPGDRYLAVARASGGVQGSVCDTDLAPVVEAVGDVSVEWTTRFVLQAVPESGSVQVTVDGTLQDEGWLLEQDSETVDGTTVERVVLVFEDAPPAGAEIEVRYRLGAPS